jgi:hypothetical protein
LRLIVTNGGGEIPASDGMKQLHANGAKPAASTLYRARKRAGIKAHKAGFGGGWVWSYHPAEDSTKNPKNPKNPGSGEMESTESSAAPVESSGDPASVDEPGEPDTPAPVDEPTPNPVALHPGDVSLTAPKPLRDMTQEDHAELGRRLRETALRPNPDEPEEP